MVLIRENKSKTPIPSLKSPGSLTTTVGNVGAQSAIHTSQPSPRAWVLGMWLRGRPEIATNSKTKLRCHCLRHHSCNLIKCICFVCRCIFLCFCCGIGPRLVSFSKKEKGRPMELPFVSRLTYFIQEKLTRTRIYPTYPDRSRHN